MIRKAPPDKQVAGMLMFLGNALQSDPFIAHWTGSSPKEVVASVVNYQPIQRTDGKTWLYVSQLPCLAYNVVSASHKRKGTRWGRTLTGNLWYLFQTPNSETGEIHGLTKAERIKSLLDWRINYWLQKQKLPKEDGEFVDLQALTDVYHVTVGNSDFFNEGNIEGLRVSVQLEHYWAPYDEDDPRVIELYDVTIINDGETSTDNAVYVDAEIDV